MVKKGDTVILNKPELSIHNERVSVYEPMVADEYAYYCGVDAIVVIRKNGQTIVATKDEYETINRENGKVVDNIVETENEINKFDVVTLNEKDRGTQRLFYQVVDSSKNGVSIIDDAGNKRFYPKGKYESVDLNGWFSYFNELSDQVHSLREFVSTSLELVVDDLQNQLKKIKQ